MTRRAGILFVALLLSLAAGCLDLRVRVGARPDERLLEQRLIMRQSTMDDVRTVLGPPFGTGASLLPMQGGPRTMWCYYYEEGTLKDDRRTFLFVYFTTDGRYEGYMWMSSLPAAGTSSAPTETHSAP